jgi:hypothetical protein
VNLAALYVLVTLLPTLLKKGYAQLVLIYLVLKKRANGKSKQKNGKSSSKKIADFIIGFPGFVFGFHRFEFFGLKIQSKQKLFSLFGFPGFCLNWIDP